tara:strand:- start:24 stop:2033 length:2010 start_codon:yes stop_codon:yes gene_type:complete
MRDIGTFLNLLRHVKAAGTNQWTADCPCPSHKTPGKHLSIGLENDTILLTCFGADTAEDIVQSLGLTMTDLFIKPDEKPAATAVKEKIVATYDYKDEDGHILFQVVRYEPKTFKQRHKNGSGQWTWNMEDIRRVPYHLPEILEHTGTIYLVEGEKDADKLWEWGQVATTSPGGASSWKSEYANYFTGKQVVVIPDKDTAGYDYAREVARSLQNKASSIKCVILPGAVKDTGDWIEAGGDIEALPSLEQDIAKLFEFDEPVYQQKGDTIVWAKSIAGQSISFGSMSLRQERTGIHSRISISYNYQPLAWSLFNIERSEDRTRLANSAHSQLKGEIKGQYSKDNLRQDIDRFCAGLWDFWVSGFIPTLMAGEEAESPPSFLLYPYILQGGGSILFSPPGKGKSQSALLWAVSIDAGIDSLWQVNKQPVLFINLERSVESLKRRLASINVLLGLPAKRPLLTLNARGKSLTAVAPAIRKSVQQYGVKLIILDSISRAGAGDLNEGTTANLVIDTLSSLCETWLALGHTPRASEEHLIGSVLADAGADIIIQLRSQILGNKLGIGYEVTKANDLPQFNQKIYAFEFEDWRLKAVRPADVAEFPDIEAKSKVDMLEAVVSFLTDQDTGDASATIIAREVGYNRVNISSLLAKRTDKFIKTRRVKTSQYYGVKQV